MFMSWVVNYIGKQFPDAPVIDTDKAKEAIENVEKKVIVVDCRRPDEYAVSKIPGAENIFFKCEDNEILEALESNGVNEQTHLIINYCSLGYRSAIMTNRIKEALSTNPSLNQVEVVNMEGSIFKWANENKPLVDHKNEPTIYVHPFSYKYALPTLSRSKWKWSTADN